MANRKRKKRKPDFRKIRKSHVYTLLEICTDLDRGLPAVRRWVKHGLPTLEGSKSALVDGYELYQWLSELWLSKKQPCGPGELYCCYCRAPTLTDFGKVRLEPKTSKTLTIFGECGVCGTHQSQTGSLAKLDEYQADFNLLAQAVQHLSVCENTSVSDNIITFSDFKAKDRRGETQLSLLDHLETGEKLPRS